MQLNLFTSTGIYCGVCGNDHGRREDKPDFWAGFFDADTAGFVGLKCRDKHYRKKQLPTGGVTYSEMPVSIAGAGIFRSIQGRGK
jgi:hypothetical protein